MAAAAAAACSSSSMLQQPPNPLTSLDLRSLCLELSPAGLSLAELHFDEGDIPCLLISTQLALLCCISLAQSLALLNFSGTSLELHNELEVQGWQSGVCGAAAAAAAAAAERISGSCLVVSAAEGWQQPGSSFCWPATLHCV